MCTAAPSRHQTRRILVHAEFTMVLGLIPVLELHAYDAQVYDQSRSVCTLTTVGHVHGPENRRPAPGWVLQKCPLQITFLLVKGTNRPHARLSAKALQRGGCNRKMNGVDTKAWGSPSLPLSLWCEFYFRELYIEGLVNNVELPTVPRWVSQRHLLDLFLPAVVHQALS